MIYTLTLNPALDRELRVPEIAFGEVLRATSHRVDAGGKGFNVSRALAALGEPSVALGLVGGAAGRAIAEDLARHGLRTEFVPIAGETRTNVSIVSEARHVKVNEAGPAVGPEEQARLVERVRELARPGDWWVLSGSLPPGVPEALYGELVKLVQAVGAQAVLDTSGPALRHGCAAGPFLAKPNAAEAAELTGLPTGTAEEAHAAAAAIRAAGVHNVLVSLGKRGALLATGAEGWLARPPAVEERNPIGAGDAMVAGMVMGLARGRPPAEALRWGVASGAAAASLAGTAFGTYALVEELVPRVELAPL